MCWVRMAKSCPGGHWEGDWGVQVSTQTPKTLCKVWPCHYSLRGVRQVHAKKGHWDYQPSPPTLSETTEIQWDSGQNPSRSTRCVLWGHFARINFNLNNFVWGRVATISLVFLMCFHIFIALKKHLSLQCILCSQSWAVVKKLTYKAEEPLWLGQKSSAWSTGDSHLSWGDPFLSLQVPLNAPFPFFCYSFAETWWLRWDCSADWIGRF